MSSEINNEELKPKEGKELGDVAMLVGVSKKIANFAENKRTKSVQLFGHLETLKSRMVSRSSCILSIQFSFCYTPTITMSATYLLAYTHMLSCHTCFFGALF